jgi:hypothetical protein
MLIALLAMWAVLILPSYFLIAQQMPHQDIDQRYIGAWAVLTSLVAGEQPPSPYDPEVTLQIQEHIYGRPALPGEDQQAFAYPAHILFLMLPLWLLPSLEWAAGVWTALQFAVLLLLPFFVAGYFRWNMRLRIGLVGLAASTLGFRYSMMALVLGQFTILAVFWSIGAIWAITGRRAALGAFFLAMLTIRPEGALLVGLLVVIALVERRFEIAAAWGALMVLLWLATTAVIGPWIDPFIAAFRAYSQYADTRWLPQIVGPVGALVIPPGVLAWCVWMVYETRRQPLRERLAWVLSAVTLAGLVLLPQTNPYTLVYALLPVWTAVWAGRTRPAIQGAAFAAGVELGLFPTRTCGPGGPGSTAAAAGLDANPGVGMARSQGGISRRAPAGFRLLILPLTPALPALIISYIVTPGGVAPGLFLNPIACSKNQSLEKFDGSASQEKTLPRPAGSPPRARRAEPAPPGPL